MKDVVVPEHVAIIMDGNGRWAQRRGLDRSQGHLAGSRTLKEVGMYAFKRGVKVLSLYAFSTDNFKRDPQEVKFIMDLLVKLFVKEFKIFIDNDIKVVISGRKDNLRDDVLQVIDNIVDKTKNNARGILNICFNYGSQEEIIDATKRIVDDINTKKITLEDITKESFMKYMYQDLPAIDFVIRTSGEQRLSNFMLYQASYAELYFPEILFPDFKEQEFDLAIEYYNKRDRRFGGINEKKSN